MLDRYIVPIARTNGLYYKITEKGASFNIKMNDYYFNQLKILVLKVFTTYGAKSEKDIHKEINKKIRR